MYIYTYVQIRSKLLFVILRKVHTLCWYLDPLRRYQVEILTQTFGTHVQQGWTTRFPLFFLPRLEEQLEIHSLLP